MANTHWKAKQGKKGKTPFAVKTAMKKKVGKAASKVMFGEKK